MSLTTSANYNLGVPRSYHNLLSSTENSQVSSVFESENISFDIEGISARKPFQDDENSSSLLPLSKSIQKTVITQQKRAYKKRQKKDKEPQEEVFEKLPVFILKKTGEIYLKEDVDKMMKSEPKKENNNKALKKKESNMEIQKTQEKINTKENVDKVQENAVPERNKVERIWYDKKDKEVYFELETEKEKVIVSRREVAMKSHALLVDIYEEFLDFSKFGDGNKEFKLKKPAT